MCLYNDLLRFITTLSKDPQLAADIVQDTMETVWTKLERIESYTDLKQILFTIGKNKLTSYYRKNRTEQKAFPLIEKEQLTKSEEDFIQRLMQQEDRRRLLFQISRLREDYSRIILLHYFYGLSLKEIAIITCTNYNTLVSWHRRALRQLGLYLTRHETIR